LPQFIRFSVCLFFQSEDGIRVDLVTGVQTCALPISRPAIALARWPVAGLRYASHRSDLVAHRRPPRRRRTMAGRAGAARRSGVRSEERRVGKEWRYVWDGTQ